MMGRTLYYQVLPQGGGWGIGWRRVDGSVRPLRGVFYRREADAVAEAYRAQAVHDDVDRMAVTERVIRKYVRP